VLLALFKLRTLLDGDLRLRTACNLETKDTKIVATKPAGFALPSAADLAKGLAEAIAAANDQMPVTTVTFNDELKKAKDEANKDDAPEDADGEES
jgi:CRISPR-associated protein Csb1